MNIRDELQKIAKSHFLQSISHAIYVDALGQMVRDGKVIDAPTAIEAAKQRHQESADAIGSFFMLAQEAAFEALLHVVPKTSVDALKAALDAGDLEQHGSPPPPPPAAPPQPVAAPGVTEDALSKLIAEGVAKALAAAKGE